MRMDCLKKLSLILLLLFVIPSFASAKEFVVDQPTEQETILAILEASRTTTVRPALLYGLFGQETAYGGNLGKTESRWSAFCASRTTQDCRNWVRYDCKEGYTNAKHYDEILKSLGFVDANGNADRTKIPTSSTCALGFTQFEPNTWWLVTKDKSGTYSPWDIDDSILIAAYYLQDLGADDSEALGANAVIGPRDKIALQKYYCGGYYTRRECVDYANGVENRSKNAPIELLTADLEKQIEILQRQQIARQSVPSFQPPPPPTSPEPVLTPPPTSLPTIKLALTSAIRGENIHDIAYDFTSLYVVGRDNQDKWRIEKHSLLDGSLDNAFGKNGVITSDAKVSRDNSKNNKLFITVDPTYMYVVGIDEAENTIGASTLWRIEKRFLSTGILDANFGRNGVVTGNVSLLTPREIVASSRYIYVAGLDKGLHWRVEKRFASNGSLDAGFGSIGAVASDAVANSYSEKLFLVPDIDYFYVVGSDRSNGWRTEKRSLLNGTLDKDFADQGKALLNYSSLPSFIKLRTVTFEYPYMYVGGSVGFGAIIEKRSVSDGEIDYQFGINGITAFTPEQNYITQKINDMVIVPPSVYSSIFSEGIYQSESSIEKRYLSTGFLDTSFGSFGVIRKYEKYVRSLFTDFLYLYIFPEEKQNEWQLERYLLSSSVLDTAFSVESILQVPPTQAPPPAGPASTGGPAPAPGTPPAGSSIGTPPPSGELVPPPTTLPGTIPPPAPIGDGASPLLPFIPSPVEGLPPPPPPPPPVPPISIFTTVFPKGIQGVSYKVEIIASGGISPYRWSIADGDLPTGLRLDPSSGIIAGTPEETITTAITIRITDRRGIHETKWFTFTINPPLSITTTEFPIGKVQNYYSVTLKAEGGVSPYIWNIDSAVLPEGLNLNPSSGVISGIPTAFSSINFLARVTDQKNDGDTKWLAIDIQRLPVIINTTTLPKGEVGMPYTTTTLSVSSGIEPIVWSTVSSALPDGLTLGSNTGIISGVPTTAQATTVSIRATDDVGTTSETIPFIIEITIP